MTKPKTITHCIDIFENALNIQKYMQYETMTLSFSEHDLKSILYWLMAWRSLYNNYESLFNEGR